jgi:hypothetical protein
MLGSREVSYVKMRVSKFFAGKGMNSSISEGGNWVEYVMDARPLMTAYHRFDSKSGIIPFFQGESSGAEIFPVSRFEKKEGGLTRLFYDTLFVVVHKAASNCTFT